VKFFIDNNLSQQLANGMKAFGEPVEHLKEKFPENTDDLVWLKYVGQQKIFLVTRDDRMRHNQMELQSLKKHKVGAFFLGGKNLNRCRLIQQLVRNWPRMKDYAKKERRPFAFRVPPTGTKFMRISLR